MVADLRLDAVQMFKNNPIKLASIRFGNKILRWQDQYNGDC